MTAYFLCPSCKQPMIISSVSYGSVCNTCLYGTNQAVATTITKAINIRSVDFLEQENQKLKEKLDNAIEMLNNLKNSFWSSAYGEMADELSKTEEFLKSMEIK